MLSNLPEDHGIALTCKDSSILVLINLKFHFKNKRLMVVDPIKLPFLSLLPSLLDFSFRSRTWDLHCSYGPLLAKVTGDRLTQQTLSS